MYIYLAVFISRLRAVITWSHNLQARHGVSVQLKASFARQLWLFATQSQNTAAQCGQDPATPVS